MRCDVSWDTKLYATGDTLSLRYLEIRYGKTLETQRYLEISRDTDTSSLRRIPRRAVRVRRAAPRRIDTV